MIEATYIVLEWIKTRLNAILDPDTIGMYPGRFAAESADISSATYSVRMNLNFQMPHVSTDSISLTIYHQDYDVLQRMVSVLLAALNPEHAKENASLYAAGIAEDIKFHMIAAISGKQDNNAFIEGTEYYVTNIDILIQYVNLAGPDIASDQALYINGV